MKLLKFAVVSLSCMLFPVIAQASTVCPALTGASSTYYAAATVAGTNCNTLITINANGTVSIAFPNANPYDGSDDNYVGIVNNFGSTVSNIALTANTDIFGFDGDGIDAYGLAGNAIDTATYGSGAYGGADAYFTNISNANQNGTVNFIGGLASGGSGYFSLEEAPSAGSITTGPITTVTPEPGSLILLGTGALGLVGVVRRRMKL